MTSVSTCSDSTTSASPTTRPVVPGRKVTGQPGISAPPASKAKARTSSSSSNVGRSVPSHTTRAEPSGATASRGMPSSRRRGSASRGVAVRRGRGGASAEPFGLGIDTSSEPSAPGRHLTGVRRARGSEDRQSRRTPAEVAPRARRSTKRGWLPRECSPRARSGRASSPPDSVGRRPRGRHGCHRGCRRCHGHDRRRRRCTADDQDQAHQQRSDAARHSTAPPGVTKCDTPMGAARGDSDDRPLRQSHGGCRVTLVDREGDAAERFLVEDAAPHRRIGERCAPARPGARPLTTARTPRRRRRAGRGPPRAAPDRGELQVAEPST